MTEQKKKYIESFRFCPAMLHIVPVYLFIDDVVGNNINSQIFDYTSNLIIGGLTNIGSFDVYINNDYYGSDLSEIQINTDDKLKLVVVKNDNTKDSIIKLFGNPI